jgi:hypothetical protein
MAMSQTTKRTKGVITIVATTSESSPTNQEQDGSTTTAVLELGKLLASELEHTDTLGRWIAHHLAERITGLQQKTESERAIAETEVVDLILRLWALRRQLPGRRLPLAEVDEVEATIARLAPGRRPWAYFGAFAADTEPSTAATEASTTLKAALLVDRLAGDLVHGLIGHAAALAEGDEAAWVTKAEQIGDETLRRVRRVRFDHDGDEGATASQDWISEVKTRATALSSVLAALVADLNVEGSDFPDQVGD